jgi:Fic-DOC domain mobile mystery protein B
MPIKLEYPEGATPLDPNEMEGLIPSHISTQGQLNEAEQANIISARDWLAKGKHKSLITDSFIRTLHKQMFSDVWKWAGQYRKTDKNIGVSSHQIATDIRQLCDDTVYWIKNKTYPWDELGARFHHKLVSIHAFANGNGRHARMMTDALLLVNNEKVFTWGAQSKNETGQEDDSRKAYLEALREADQNKFTKLIKFVRS